MCGKTDDREHDESFITTSPLDYHIFRQELISKYPAYSPPPPLVPIEDQNNSTLPPLSTHPSRHTSQDNLQASIGSDFSKSRESIFHQPVHIATPVPSPPPSPAGPGGKGGKKQNYQTNQNFPFLYPPLDDTANTVGVGANSELHRLVSRKWQGSDVPASIIEAGQLFASRMRMSRSMRQLWEVREQYVVHERGWNAPDLVGAKKDDCTSDSDDEKDNADDSSDPGRGSSRDDDYINFEVHSGDKVQDRLKIIDDLYVSFFRLLILLD